MSRTDAALFVPTSASIQRTLAEQAVAALYSRIMSGELPPGRSLRLAELADELGMSLSPVREGLRRLETLGLVEIASHRGARVREVSVDDFEDTQATRRSLESLAIRLAAERFTEADAEAAGAALSAHVAHFDRGDQLAARREHTLFHFALYRAGGSKWLLRGIEPVWENSERYRFTGEPDAEHAAESNREHSAILDACERHDPDAAVDALTAHIDRASARMRSALAARLDATASTTTASATTASVTTQREESR